VRCGYRVLPLNAALSERELEIVLACVRGLSVVSTHRAAEGFDVRQRGA
jgi:hypothetical protein